MTNANDKIDLATKAAKLKAEKVIDDIAEVVVLAAAKAGQHMHDAGARVRDAGEKVRNAGDKLMKATD